MKQLSITILLGLLLTSCGIREELAKACVPGDVQFVCYAFLGSPADDDSKLEDRVTALEQQMIDLETSISNLINYIELVITDNENDINNVQNQIDLLVVQLAALQTNLSITEIIDPCGDGVGYDEVVLRLSDGSLIAYMEVGQGQGIQKRFLAVLTPGNYITTDQQACVFTVDSNGDLSY